MGSFGNGQVVDVFRKSASIFSSFHRRYRSFGCRPESQAEVLFQVQTVMDGEVKVLWNSEDSYSPGAQLEA